MSYLRRISEADAFVALPRYRALIAASPESAIVLGCWIEPGGRPPLHTHDVDLFYVVLSGMARVRLGHDSHRAVAGDLIYIPAGLPHGSDNQSGAIEHHLEILVPGLQPGAPTQTNLETAADVPLPTIPPYVRSVTDPGLVTTSRGRHRILADTAPGAESARIRWIERAGPEAPDQAVSLDTDRLVIVTAGKLSADVAAESAVATAEALIVIPAGVPHRIWNSSAAPVRYLDVALVAPTAYQRLAPQGVSSRLDRGDQPPDEGVDSTAAPLIGQC